MKKLIYLWLLASVLLAAACTDDDDVFSEESGVRLQAVIDECNTTLRGAENGWKMVYYPKVESYGGYTFLFKFGTKNRVQMISDFDMSEDTDYSYNFNTSESVVLTFDSYSPLHRLADPQYPAPDYSNKKGYGVEGDFEFVVKKVTADTLYLVGKKNRVEVLLTKATGEDWLLVSMMAEMSSCFALSENERLGMSVHGVLMASGLVELDDIYHICKISYKDEEGDAVSVESPYIMTGKGCQFIQEIEVAGIKFSGLNVDLSEGFNNREFVSNDEGGSIRFFIQNFAPLNLTRDQIPTYVPNKNIASVDLLRTTNGNDVRYVITEMSSELEAQRDIIREKLPNFIDFYLELNRKDGYDGSFRIGAYQGTSVKYYNYDFKTFELLDNSVNKVVFDNQAASSSTSGFIDKDLYSIKKNKNTKAVYDAFFSGDGFVVIRDSDTVYWIRSLKDPNVWMKLEED